MTPAREEFVQRLDALRRLVQDPTTLTALQHSLTDRDASERARLLRNGLAVSAFALVEAFLKVRVAEVLTHVANSPLAFSELPAKLQEMCTVEVVNALRFQADVRSRSGEDVYPLIQRTGRSLSSTASVPYELSGLAFGQSRSNLGAEEVKSVLRAFNIRDGWGNVTQFARRIGLAPLNAKEDFASAARRRHRGAHDVGAEIPVGDLQEFPAQALGIAAGFDALLSRAGYHLLSGDKIFSREEVSVTAADISIRFVEGDGAGNHRDVAEGKSRSALNGRDRETVLAASLGRAARTGAVVVVRDQGNPRAWEPTDLGPGRP